MGSRAVPDAPLGLQPSPAAYHHHFSQVANHQATFQQPPPASYPSSSQQQHVVHHMTPYSVSPVSRPLSATMNGSTPPYAYAAATPPTHTVVAPHSQPGQPTGLLPAFSLQVPTVPRYSYGYSSSIQRPPGQADYLPAQQFQHNGGVGCGGGGGGGAFLGCPVFNPSPPGLSPGYSHSPASSTGFPHSPMSTNASPHSNLRHQITVPTQAYPVPHRAPSLDAVEVDVQTAKEYVNPSLFNNRPFERSISYDGGSSAVKLEPDKARTSPPRFAMYDFVGGPGGMARPAISHPVRPAFPDADFARPVSTCQSGTSIAPSPRPSPTDGVFLGNVHVNWSPTENNADMLSDAGSEGSDEEDVKPDIHDKSHSPTPELLGRQEPDFVSNSPAPSSLPSHRSSPLPTEFRGVQKPEWVRRNRRPSQHRRQYESEGEPERSDLSDSDSEAPEDKDDSEFVPGMVSTKSRSRKRTRRGSTTTSLGRPVVSRNVSVSATPAAAVATMSTFTGPVPASAAQPPPVSLFALLQVYPDIPRLYPLFYYTLLNDLKLNPDAAPMIGTIPQTYSQLEKSDALRAFFHRGRRMLAQLDAFTARCEVHIDQFGTRAWPPIDRAMRVAIREVRRKIVERCENYKYTRRDILDKYVQGPVVMTDTHRQLGKGRWAPIEQGMVEWKPGMNNADPAMDLRGVSLVRPTAPGVGVGMGMGGPPHTQTQTMPQTQAQIQTQTPQLPSTGSRHAHPMPPRPKIKDEVVSPKSPQQHGWPQKRPRAVPTASPAPATATVLVSTTPPDATTRATASTSSTSSNGGRDGQDTAHPGHQAAPKRRKRNNTSEGSSGTSGTNQSPQAAYLDRDAMHSRQQEYGPYRYDGRAGMDDE